MTSRLNSYLSPGPVLIALALLMALTLIGTSLGTYLQLRASSQGVVRAHALALIEMTRGGLRLLDEPPERGDLQAIIADNANRGLRYIAVERGGQRLVAGEATISRGPPPPPRLAHQRRRLHIEQQGERVRATWHRRKFNRFRPRDRRLHREGHRWGGSPRTIIVEFEPTVANKLLFQAHRNVWVSALVALVLVGLSIALARWLRKKNQLERQLLERRRLAGLGEASAVLAHEIRNPLASLKGHAQLLEELLAEGSKERRKADQVVQEAQRLEALINQLLEYVRTGAICRQSVALGPWLERVVGGSHAELSQMGDVVVRRDEMPESWSFDPDRMQQVLSNLLENARAATLSGTEVEVLLRVVKNSLEIQVLDRGPGIAAGEEESIFEPFRTGKTRGTGLGLAVARRIVEAHGGTLTAANRPQGGACLTVRLRPQVE